jgi:hypothetical protein
MQEHTMIAFLPGYKSSVPAFKKFLNLAAPSS